ncbi:hypothetical protein KDH_61260 [Dictyobacter sp. S3.2.2.5]|uniref:AAA+ ATPase domain-containing protein n=1 Tax=Dictyobacter halimunensis TaxID=3026934 RepID=A0ABQ6G222_9CHLR|nr:hypothetical protein KDH_61260 [Dictyobacter sp. S3.2.2.5]
MKQIVKTLADWDAITTRAEAGQLLSIMGLKVEAFSEPEWGSAPLDKLEAEQPQPESGPSAATTTVATSTTSPVHSDYVLPGPTTALIGREYQVELLLDRLLQPAVRLVTLFGMGGVGKTRLALEVAHVLKRDFADGVFFISLTSIREVAFVPATIVQALRLMTATGEGNPDQPGALGPEDILKQFLQNKKLLLILDNVEQIPDIAPFVSDLLQSAQTIKIMVTSRVLLHLYGEYEFDVPPLTICPSPDLVNIETLEQFSAIRLFVERAQSVDPTFRITPRNARTISQICTRLDGLPLAIELAAARVKVLPLADILQWLMTGRGGSILRTSAYNMLQRHQTLQAMLDWSYELQPPLYQTLFRRYGVFVDGWTLEAARAVVLFDNPEATIPDVLEQMEFLIDQSLLKRMRPEEGFAIGETQEPRFYLLETIREYALGQLNAADELAQVQQWHACYYLVLAEKGASSLAGDGQLAAMALFMREQGNLRAALAWATENGESKMALRISSALGHFWEARMQFHSALRWVDALFAMRSDTPSSMHAKLLMGTARLVLWEVGCERSRELAQQALRLYEADGNRVGRAWALFHIGDTWHIQGDYVRAIPYLEESSQLLYEQEDWRNYAFALSRLGALATLQGNIQQARTWLGEAMRLLREYDESGVLTITLVYLGILAFLQGDLPLSSDYLREGMWLARKTGNNYMLAADLLTLGCVLGRLRGPFFTAHICAAAEALYESLNSTVPVAYRPLYFANRDRMQAQVNVETWERWWIEGRNLSMEEICALAEKTSAQN